MKKVGAWSIDMQILNWIDTKLGSKSQFVNRILKDAMLDEILSQAKREQRPKCSVCRMRMSPNLVDDDGDWRCGNLHCKAMGEFE
jgi:hypothetical protein